jgi:hypothetical protein
VDVALTLVFPARSVPLPAYVPPTVGDEFRKARTASFFWSTSTGAFDRSALNGAPGVPDDGLGLTIAC